MVRLGEIPTKAPAHLSKKDIQEATRGLVRRLGKLHHLLYAEGKHCALVVLQGMDASGKDGALRNVFSECTIAGLNLVSFKKPHELEMNHDFLWRVHQAVPQKGYLTVFNRSHYEDILIQRVNHWIDMERVALRMEAINAFERLLAFDNNTQIFKFYMHISKEEQERQLQQRIDEPDKRWKHNPNDWKERQQWDAYMEAYEYAINSSEIPWTICPVDNRWYRDYVIAKTIVEGLEQLDMRLPE
jgi:PPK2 family polyphosphate:nucleotide phosphotransferase